MRCVRVSLLAAVERVQLRVLSMPAQSTCMDCQLSLYPLWAGSSKEDTPKTGTPTEEVGDYMETLQDHCSMCVCLCARMCSVHNLCDMA